MRYYIGTSGWHYEHWKGSFYPPGLPKTGWLEYYARHFPTVELNSSFYHLPTDKAFNSWKNSSPAGFVYSVKVSRLITHLKKLRDCEGPLTNFIARAQLLGDKLGPLLYQLPPDLKREERILEDFIRILPQDKCHVFEFRDSSWFEEGIFDILSRYNCGLCIYDMPGFSSPMVATCGFAYLRFHGSQSLYGGCYSDDELKYWAGKIRGMNVNNVYAYFNNDAGGFAIQNAITLKQLLG